MDRDGVVAALSQQGISAAIYYPIPVHRQAAVRELGLGEGSFPVAERMAREVLSIPVHPALTEQERAFVAGTIVEGALASAR